MKGTYHQDDIFDLTIAFRNLETTHKTISWCFYGLFFVFYGSTSSYVLLVLSLFNQE